MNRDSVDQYEYLYHKVATELAKTLVEKRTAYGDNLVAGEQFLEIFFPEGVPVTAYRYILIVARILDKIFRWANQCKLADEGIPWEDQESPFLDIGGYGIATCVDEMMRKEDNATQE